jgi:hypothetical protein
MNHRLQDALFCVICIAALLINAAIFRARAVEYADGDPAMLAQAERMLKTLVGYVGGLFVLLMVGAGLGLTGRSLIGFEHAPWTWFEIAFLVVYAGVLLRATWWVYAQGGAERLAEHHEMFKYFPRTKAGVRILWAALICGIGYALLELAGR